MASNDSPVLGPDVYPPCAAHLQRTIAVEESLSRLEKVVLGNGGLGLDEQVRALAERAKRSEETLDTVEKDLKNIKVAIWVVAGYFAAMGWGLKDVILKLLGG